MNEKLTIAVLVGTTREQRKSIVAAKYIAEVGRGLEDVEIVLVDPKDFVFNGDGNDPEGRNAQYTEITAAADAFFIVTPEYNHSFPGSLKRMLDSEYDNYLHKPVAMAGVSNGNWGGARAVESLVPVLRQLGLVMMRSDTYFPRVQDMFDEAGTIKPEIEERTSASVKSIYKELLWMARVLKAARENL
jgi:NAD(P)H-dependent FMN reductase